MKTFSSYSSSSFAYHGSFSRGDIVRNGGRKTKGIAHSRNAKIVHFIVEENTGCGRLHLTSKEEVDSCGVCERKA